MIRWRRTVDNDILCTNNKRATKPELFAAFGSNLRVAERRRDADPGQLAEIAGTPADWVSKSTSSTTCRPLHCGLRWGTGTSRAEKEAKVADGRVPEHTVQCGSARPVEEQDGETSNDEWTRRCWGATRIVPGQTCGGGLLQPIKAVLAKLPCWTVCCSWVVVMQRGNVDTSATCKTLDSSKICTWRRPSCWSGVVAQPTSVIVAAVF